MKLLHTSDLHIGKIVNGFSMLEDQRYILSQILDIADEEHPDAILISGDIHDRSIPPAEAVSLLDDFLTSLATRHISTYIIYGNHDSAERTAFASRLIDGSGIHLSTVYSDHITPFTHTDEFGAVDIYMLPFIKPAIVSEIFPEEKGDIHSYTDAVSVAIKHLNIDTSRRNILLTHQFVTGAERSDSEEKSLGGADNVDAGVFSAFDYVALGHVHRPQTIVPDRIRYSGSPLKYSFSERPYEKSVTIIELGASDVSEGKCDIKLRTAPLHPLHDLQEIKDTYDTLMSRAFYETLPRDDYYHVILTDEHDVMNALDRLRTVYPNIMVLSYDNSRTRTASDTLKDIKIEDMSPYNLFSDFYERQNGRPLDSNQEEYIKSLISKLWEND